MKNILLSLFVFCALFGCTVFKHTEKTTTDVKTSEKQHVMTVTDETITSVMDTVVKFTPDTIRKDKPINVFLQDSIITVENDTLKGTVTIEKNGTINLIAISKARVVHVVNKSTINRQTTTVADTDTKTSAKTTEKKIEVERKWFSWSWLWWLLVPAIVFGAYKAYQIFKPKL